MVLVFEEQVDRLIELGYPGLAGLKDDELRELLEPLRAAAERLDAVADDEPGHAAYVVVVTRELVDPDDTVPLLRLAGARGLRSLRAWSIATTRRGTWRPTTRCRSWASRGGHTCWSTWTAARSSVASAPRTRCR